MLSDSKDAVQIGFANCITFGSRYFWFLACLGVSFWSPRAKNIEFEMEKECDAEVEAYFLIKSERMADDAKAVGAFFKAEIG